MFKPWSLNFLNKILMARKQACSDLLICFDDLFELLRRLQRTSAMTDNGNKHTDMYKYKYGPL